MKKRFSSSVVRICLLALVVTASPLYPAYADLSEGLVGYWSFDSGDATDYSANGYHGVIYGDPQPVDGVKGMGLRFDGVGDRIEVTGANLAGATMTTSVWVKLEEGLKGIILVKMDRVGANGVNYETSFDTRSELPLCVFVRTEDGRDDNDYHVAYEFPNGREAGWAHIVQVLRGHQFELYVNGERKSIDRTPGGFRPYMGDAPLQFGGDCVSGNTSDYRSFNGVIDEVRVYNRPLDPAEIEELYEECASRPMVGPSGIVWK